MIDAHITIFANNKHNLNKYILIYLGPLLFMNNLI